MIDFLSPVLEKNGARWSAVSVEGVTYLVFALPYVQLSTVPDGYAFIDSYYVASNRAYFLRKELVSSLGEAGFTAVECKLGYKNLAVASGLGVWLRSTLVANEVFGTRMALEVVAAKGVFAKEITLAQVYAAPVVGERCENCTVCRRLCPCGCIGDDNGFDAQRCIRHEQDNGFFSDESVAAAAGVSLWGCDICQRFCPYNKHLGERALSEEEAELFRLETLFEVFWSGKRACEPYRNIFGSNYIRPTRLLALTLNAMMNSGDTAKYLPYAEKALTHNDERVRAAAQRLVNKIKQA